MYALYYTHKVSCQPLMQPMYMSDLYYQLPGSAEALARTLVAVLETAQEVAQSYAPYCGPRQAQTTSPAGERNKHIAEGIPHLLSSRWVGLDQQVGCCMHSIPRE